MVNAPNAVINGGGSGMFVQPANNSTGPLTVNAGSTVSGNAHGIFARNRGTGAISITAVGTVNGTTRNGILADHNNANNTGTVTVQAADVTAAQYGIFARNRGLGGVNVTSTGSVVGGSNDGIYADANRGTGMGDVVVNAVSSSGSRGIFARAVGSGSVSVTSTGAIVGTAGVGISATTTRNRPVNANVTVNTFGTVNATAGGIFAQANGNGTVTVNARDTVTSTNDAGITANIRRGSGTGNISVSAVDVSARRRGVQVDNRGLGAVDVTLTGRVSSTLNEGVFLFSRNNANTNAMTVNAESVDSRNTAISVRNNTRGATQITTTGTLNSTNGGGIAVNASAGASTGAVNITTASAITARTNGITVTKNGQGAVTVDAQADVTVQTGSGINVQARTGTNADDITINAQNVQGRNGVVANHNGTGALNITLAGQATGLNGDGINARIQRATSTAGITINSQSVSGTNDGVEIRHDGRGAVLLNAQGSLVGTGGRGLYARQTNTAATGDMELNVQQVNGRIGVEATTSGLGNLTINATDTVTATGSNGIRAVANTATNAGTLTINAVDVTGTTGVSAVHNGIGAMNLNVSGTATATNGTGIFAAKYRAVGTGDITINAANAVGRTAVYAEHRGTGDINVTTTGTINGTAGSGLNLRQRNATTTAAVRVNALGDVTGRNSGIEVQHESSQGSIDVRSTGQVTGTQQRGIYLRHTRNGATGSITVDANDVTGRVHGIEAQTRTSGAIDITTRGTVTATVNDGVFALGRDTINVNVASGTVSGARNGISFQEINATLAAAMVTIQAGATVSGGTGSGFQDSDVTRGSRATTLDIAGTLNAGGNGFAARLGRGDDTAILRETEVITGNVDGGVGTDLLRFDYASDRSFVASRMTTQFQNFENYEKTGPAAMTLTGADAGARDFAVLNGSLIANATVAMTDFTIATGALIGGTGTVGDLTVNGTVSPGSNAIGTLTVDGNVSLNDNSTLSVQISPNGTPDLLDITGAATISANGTVLDVQGIAGAYPKTTGPFTVLQTVAGVTGQFANVQDGLPDLDLQAVYDGSTVKLVYVQAASASSDKSAIASVPVAGLQTSLIFANTIERRARTLLPAAILDGQNSFYPARYGADVAGIKDTNNTITAFVQGVVETLDVGRDGTRAGYRLDSRGLIAGFEGSTVLGAGDAVFGLAGGTIRTDASVSPGDLEVESYQAGLYGAYRNGSLALSGSATYAYLDYDVTRFVQTATGRLTGVGSTTGDAVSVVADVSYDVVPLLAMPYSMTLSPFLHGELHHATTEAFTESGLGVLDLDVASTAMTMGVLETGLRFGAEYVVDDVIMRPEAMLGYRRLLGDRALTVGSRINFANINFEDTVAKQAQDQLLFGVGLTLEQDNLSTSFRYEGAAGDDTLNHTGQFSFSLKF